MKSPTPWNIPVDATTTSNLSAVTASTIAVVSCSPTGIPSQPIEMMVQLDVWPPLAGSLRFPVPLPSSTEFSSSARNLRVLDARGWRMADDW
jgi:hypothetical protein